MVKAIQHDAILLGGKPKVSNTDLANPNRYVVPTIFLMLAAMLLVVSVFVPYWQMDLFAPQYPQGLSVETYVNRMTGDVQEVDTLNHYIGMAKLDDAAKLERSLSLVLLGTFSLLLVAAIFVHNWWAAIFAVPTLIYPGIFLLDLYYWLNRFGHSLDPKAPLSHAIKPFTPTLLGVGKVGQFRTEAALGLGFYLALGAIAAVLVGLYFHRRAYKPLLPPSIRKTSN